MTKKNIIDPVMVEFKDDKITIISSTALPPGSRVEFELAEPLVKLQGKVLTITSEQENTFRYKIRLHTLTRDQRLSLSEKNN